MLWLKDYKNYRKEKELWRKHFDPKHRNVLIVYGNILIDIIFIRQCGDTCHEHQIHTLHIIIDDCFKVSYHWWQWCHYHVVASHMTTLDLRPILNKPTPNVIPSIFSAGFARPSELWLIQTSTIQSRPNYCVCVCACAESDVCLCVCNRHMTGCNWLRSDPSGVNNGAGLRSRLSPSGVLRSCIRTRVQKHRVCEEERRTEHAQGSCRDMEILTPIDDFQLKLKKKTPKRQRK